MCVHCAVLPSLIPLYLNVCVRWPDEGVNVLRLPPRIIVPLSDAE